MTFKIDKDVPMPVMVDHPGRPHKYPFAKMEVGDSFAVLLNETTTSKGKYNLAHSLGSCARRYAKMHGGVFTVRTDDSEIRCWKIK